MSQCQEQQQQQQQQQQQINEPYKLVCGKDNQVLVFDADVVLKLRTDHQIVGSLEGSHPTNPLQNGFMYLPLLLLPEETALLLERGAVELHGEPFTWPEGDQDKIRFGLFKDLHSRGYYITRGLKFGEPMRFHSSHIVSLVDHKQPFTPRELIALVRLGTTVKKTRVLSSWNQNSSNFTHVCMNWSAM
ncbi:tRNA-splicing endonuclease subunit [Coemansia umbellata]|uniref:tRNA-intron lyase n=1 Tax=Coemansia umbellata TaxID=1424467 RepID=A0ABQ8PRQ3_9FUNG|nr:tRNA-splicing endonuclease subunit [Coemansia umbellata]